MAVQPARPVGAAVLAVVASVVTLTLVTSGWILLGGARGGTRLWTVTAQETVWAVCFLVIGLLIAARDTRRALGWVGLSVAVQSAALLWYFGMSATGRDGFSTWVGFFAAAGDDMALLLLVPLFPASVLPSRRWRWMVVAVAATGLLQMVADLVRSPLVRDAPSVHSPFYSPSLAGAATVVGHVGYAGYLVCWAVCVLGLVRRARELDPGIRKQVAFVLPSIVLSVVAETVQAWFWQPSSTYVGFAVPDAVFGTLRVAGAVAAPLAIGYMIINSRLYQLDRAVRSGAVALTVVFVLGATYVLAVAALSAWLSGAWSGGALAVGAVTGIAGAGLVPVIGRVRRRVDRYFYGERAEPLRAMRALSERLADRVDEQEVPLVVCQSLVSLFRVPGAALESGGRRLAEAGVFTGEPARFPLRFVPGHLLVWPREGQQSLDDGDTVALRAVADQIGAMLASVAPQGDQLRRDLHDNLGPTLAAVVLQLRAATTLVPERSGVRTLLDTCSVHLREVIEQMRRLARDQQPMVLDALGLTGALGELATRMSTAELPITVELAPELPELGGAAQRAVYLIAAEAVTNAVRHAAASQVSVRLRASGGSVHLVVSDDGVGMGDRRSPGVGLESMRRRADELGGDWECDSGPVGTTVSVTLPVTGRAISRS